MADMTQEQPKISKQNKPQKREYTHAVGRRKEAVARVRLYEHVKPDMKWGEAPIKKGEILVNEKPISEYFPSEVQKRLYTEPLRLTNTHQQNFAITIRVSGGGRAGQLDAVIAALANALNRLDREKYRPVLKKKGLLTRDSRIRQRRKVGTGGKSRRKKQSPKR